MTLLRKQISFQCFFFRKKGSLDVFDTAVLSFKEKTLCHFDIK